MASVPNSGAPPLADLSASVQPTAPNSGLRTDFIKNAAIFCNDHDVPAGCEVTVSTNNDVFTTNAVVENITEPVSNGELPACPHEGASAQPSAESHADSVPDFRSLMQQMKEIMCRYDGVEIPSTNSAPRTITQKEVQDNDNMSNELDNLLQTTSCNELPSDQESDVDTELLDELSSYFDLEEKTSPGIGDALASTISKGFLSHVPKERKDNLLKTYSRPSNCPTLKAPRINPALWHHMKRNARDADLQMQIMQNTTVAATFPLLQLLDKLVISNKSNQPIFGPKLQECLKLALDVFKTVQLLFSDITKRRRAAIRPTLPAAYKALCSDDVPVTTLLFGDDLDKKFKELKEADNMSKALQGPRPPHKFRPPTAQHYRPRTYTRFEPYTRGKTSSYPRGNRGIQSRGRQAPQSQPTNFLGNRRPQKQNFRKDN